jgi:hypothetical protein
MAIEGRPHWETRFPQEVWPFFEDFRNALTVTWQHLGLPEPTEAQLQIGARLQYGADSAEWESLDEDSKRSLQDNPRSDIIRCYRGAGKSYITAAYGAWLLARNPRDEKILVVSATATKSKAFVSQLRALLSTMDIYKFLLDGKRERGETRRDQADRFDVTYSSLSQSPSVRAAAILGQVTGDRATTIVADDIEIVQNSATEDSREKIINVCREFDSIVKTEHGRGDIIYLGTPQTEESVYNRQVIEQDFSCFTIPVKYPTLEKLENYSLKMMDSEERVNILAYYLRSHHDTGKLNHGELTDPKRFSWEELAKLEGKGRAYFALQFMLDTSLSDAERYPLRQHDLVVFSTNPLKAPLTIQWGRHSDNKNLIHDIPNVGFTVDHFLRPLMVDTDWEPYESSVLFVDPAGRGADETAWAIIKTLNGIMYCLHVGGHAGDPAEAMMMIAADAKRFNVNVIEIEPNYGQGMWITAFGPILTKVWPGGCTVQESEWAKGKKEDRIIDTLEPVLTQHRLVVDETLVRADARSRDSDLAYSLLYQLTHITRDRGSLKHDDRLDALAGAVAHFQRNMGQDTNEAAQAVLDQRMQDEIDDFIENYSEGFRLGRRTRRGRKRDGYRTEVTMW